MHFRFKILARIRKVGRGRGNRDKEDSEEAISTRNVKSGDKKNKYQ